MKDGNASAVTRWGLGRHSEFSNLLLCRSRNCTALSESQGEPGGLLAPTRTLAGRISVSAQLYIFIIFCKDKMNSDGKSMGNKKRERRRGVEETNLACAYTHS